jgi:acetolactate synthase I/II/III large subunit
MSDAYGRLTGRAGVCLGTLGPGATNLVTAVADAFLDRAPLVALTGQSDLERMHKESHQYIDLIGIMRPVVKWNARISSPEIVPEVVRKAFKVAESEKPGSTHPELPEDVMGRPLDASPLPRHAPVQPEPGTGELQRATKIILGASNPVTLAGNGAIRTHASRALRAFVHTTGIPVAETFMAKGLLDYEDPHALGTVGLQSRDYAMAGFDEADVVIAVGYDLVEHAPKHWDPDGAKRIVMIDTVAAEIDEFFIPEVELVGTSHTCWRGWLPNAAGRRLLRRRRAGYASSCSARSARRATMTISRCARPACSPISDGCSARPTCWCPTSRCTSSGSAGCSPRTSRVPS